MLVNRTETSPRFLPVATPAAAAPGAAPKRQAGDVLATGADPAARFEQAYQALLSTRDPAVAERQLQAMRLHAKGLPPAEVKEKLAQAIRRTAALPLLVGAPAVPAVATTRDPAPSSAAPTAAQARQAQEMMAGYGVSAAPPGLFGWLRDLVAPDPAKAPAPSFSRLSADERARFQALARAANPAGQLALDALLRDGRLTPALLDALARLAQAPLDPTVDRGLLVSQALVELADPVSIAQQGQATCAATSAQILLALEAPERYVSLLAGLASPAGMARLPGGQTIARETDWNVTSDGGRSLPSRLIQPAFMELGNGELDYLNGPDMDRDAAGALLPSGLTAEQAALLLDAAGLSAGGFETQRVTYAPGLSDAAATGLDGAIASASDMLRVLQNPEAIDPASQQALMETLKAASPEAPIYATVIYPLQTGLGFHAVLVTEVADGQVRYINPWGREESQSEGEFSRTILSANVAA